MALINFSIPTIPSFKSTTPNKTPMLFVPDVKYLVKFAQGDIGIADGIKKGMLIKNIGKMTNISQLETFMKATGATLPKSLDTYVKDGKVVINPSELGLGSGDGDLGGLKSMEKAMIQSIFETQKPYIEIIKLVTENLVKIEDIVARVLAVGGSSMRPANNPKALGYKGNGDLSSGLFKLDALKGVKTGPKSSGTGNLSPDTSVGEDNTGELPPGYFGITQSVVYSTGQFDSTVDYTYIYKDIKDDSISLPDGTASVGNNIDDSGLPKTVIFGVFDSEWKPVSESLINTSFQQSRVDGSVSKNINWINRSGKWYGQFPQIKPDIDFTYLKDNNGDVVYYKNDGPSTEINGEKVYIKDGFPKISSMVSLNSYYRTYYQEYTQSKLDKMGMSASAKQEILSEVLTKLDTQDSSGSSQIQTSIEGMMRNGFLPTSNAINTPGLGSNYSRAKYPFKVKKLNVNNNSIWTDPESKYDMKIIKCDSSLDISYLDIEGDNKQYKKTQILRFIKNTLSIKLSSNNPFNLKLIKGGKTELLNNTSEFSVDNLDPTINYSISLFNSIIPSRYISGITFELEVLGIKTGIQLTLSNGKASIGQTVGGEFISLDFSYLTNFISLTKDFISETEDVIKVPFPLNENLVFDKFGNFKYNLLFDGDLGQYLPKENQYSNIIVNSDLTISHTIGNLPPNSIRVKDDRFKYGKLISNTQITNEQLVTTKPYSRGEYGTPGDSKQSIEQIYRYMQTEDDTETYYIIEGILSSSNTQKLGSNTGNNNANSSGGGDYGFKDVVGAIPVFIDMIIDIFSKLIPAITELLTLIKNPAKFITDIIIAKLGDNFGTEPEKFGFFSKDFLDDLKKLSKIGGGVTENVSEKVSKMKEFLKTSKLKNYVHVNELGEPRFLLDGIASIDLFGDSPLLSKLPGVKFGIETKLGSLATPNPQIPFNLVFNGPKPSSLKNLPDLSGLVKKEKQKSPSNLYNTNFDPATDIPSEIKAQAGVNSVTDVSIQYSTGTYKSDVDYTYLYVTDYVKGIIDEAQKLADAGDIPKALNLLNSASKTNPTDELLQEKIAELSKLTELLGSQPILDFILNIVALPLKVVFGIISYIMDFFKSLVNPFELPSKIVDFVSFKWILDFFNPASKNSMFAMAGLLFDIKTFLTVWLPSLEAGTMDKFDLNKIMKFPWVPKLPVYNREQFRTLIYGIDGGGAPRMIPIMMLSSILCLIEGMINAFIDFVWGLLGLGALIPPPHIKLCKDTNGDLSPKDIMDLLNGNYFDDISGKAGESGNSNYNFVYNIKTSDGRDVRELNQIELDKWMQENKDLQFIFNL
jgi:hypothetical protein